VRHGVNGLVLAAGDAQDLAAALRRLVRDRSLAERRAVRRASARALPAGPGRGPGAAVRRSPVLPPPASPVREVLFVCGIERAPLRYRARLPAEALALRGVRSEVRHYRDPELTALALRADAVVLYRVPRDGAGARTAGPVPQLSRARAAVVRRRRPDLRPESGRGDPGAAAAAAQAVPAVAAGRRALPHELLACDLYLGSTLMLCEHAEAVTGLPARRLANGVGTVLAQASDAAV